MITTPELRRQVASHILAVAALVMIPGWWGPAEAATDPWPVIGQNPTHTGQATLIFPSSAAKTMDVSVGKYGFGGLVVGQDGSGADVIFGASHDSTFGDAVYAVSGSGTLLWKTPYAATVNSTPLLHPNGKLYVTASDNSIAAFDRTTGAQLWKKIIVSSTAGSQSQFSRSSPVAGPDGTIYVLADVFVLGGTAELFAIDPSGTKLWDLSLETYSNGVGAVAVMPDGTLVVVTTVVHTSWGVNAPGGRVFRLDPKTKQIIWDYRHAEAGKFVGPPAIDADESIYFAAQTLIPGSEHLMALTGAGKIKWQSTLLSSKVPPAIGPKWLYFVDTKNDLVALDKATGVVQWRHGVGAGIDANAAAPAVDQCGNVVVASTAGNVMAFGPWGNLFWKTSVSGQVIGSIAVGGKSAVYVRGYSLVGFGGTPFSACLTSPPDGGWIPDLPVPDSFVAPDSWPKTDRAVTPDSVSSPDGGPGGDQTQPSDLGPGIDGGGAGDGPAAGDGASMDAPRADAQPGASSSSGCSCRTPAGEPAGNLALVGLLGAALLLRRRRSGG